MYYIAQEYNKLHLMDNLLTTKQLQDLLKVDRTTVYRMLKTGRLMGVKVGNQWRFPRDEVEAMLSGRPAECDPAAEPAPPAETLPVPCVQAIQDVFAELADVGTVTTRPNGQPLTTISNCSRFCQLIQSSAAGQAACVESWQKLARLSPRQPQFLACHAGLQYACAPIEVNDGLEAMLVAGQFYAVPPIPTDEQTRLDTLAHKFNLDATALADAAQEIPVLTNRTQAKIGQWLRKVAQTFGQVGKERAAFRNRLRLIAEMSTLDPA